MKTFLNDSVFKVKPEIYLSLLIVIAPLLNFLSGITFDLYTPSLPDLAHYYVTSMTIVKNTVSATLFGFAVGCLIAGILLDAFGRRRIILLGLLFYAIVSFLAVFCQSINQLIIIRFFQGLLVAAPAIGCRAIVIDSFTGHRFTVALLYTSLAYGLGPIVGPFIGGILQYHFGWKMNFFAYAISALILLLVFALYVTESSVARQEFSLKNMLISYATVLRHPIFIAAIFLVGTCQLDLMLYSTVGSFIVENILRHSAIVYGNTALLVGCCYLSGTLTNRIFIKKYHLHHLTHFGFLLLILAILIQLGFAWWGPLTLFSLVMPVMLICYSQGFIFPNILSRSLKLFPMQAGIATSVLTCLGIGLAALGMFIISNISIDGLKNLSNIFTGILIIQMAIFYKSGLSKSPESNAI